MKWEYHEFLEKYGEEALFSEKPKKYIVYTVDTGEIHVFSNKREAREFASKDGWD